MNITQRQKKILLALGAVSVGFLAGFATKDMCDGQSAAHAGEPAPVKVERVDEADKHTSSRLVAPSLWDIYINPFFVPASFTEPVIPLEPLVSFDSLAQKVQTVEGEKELRVIAQVPGMTDKDVHVQVSDHAVTIKAHKIKEEKDKGRFESVDEQFEQTMHLPCKVDASKVQATVKDGVLTVILPKQSA